MPTSMRSPPIWRKRFLRRNPASCSAPRAIRSSCVRLERILVATPRPTLPVESFDRYPVLGAARVAVSPSRCAKPLQPFTAPQAEQIMNCIDKRTCMRIDRNLVLRSEHKTILRSHHRRHRSAARLMPSNLESVSLGTLITRGWPGEPRELANSLPDVVRQDPKGPRGRAKKRARQAGIRRFE